MSHGYLCILIYELMCAVLHFLWRWPDCLCESGPLKDVAMSNEAKVTASIPIWPVSFAHSHRLGCSLIMKSKLSQQRGRVVGKADYQGWYTTTSQGLLRTTDLEKWQLNHSLVCLALCSCEPFLNHPGVSPAKIHFGCSMSDWLNHFVIPSLLWLAHTSVIQLVIIPFCL